MKRTMIAVALASLLVAPLFAGEVDKAAVEAAAKKAAAYLVSVQNPDGTFGKARGAVMPGMVGLVVKGLAGSPEKLRANNPAVKKAVDYMVSRQEASGAIAIPDMGLENYNTSIAIIALASLEDPAYKDVVEKAKKYVLSCQLTEANGYKEGEHGRAFGGFGYGSSRRADLSNTGFSLEALKAAGLDENSPAYQNAIKFIQHCQDNEESDDLPEMKGGPNSGGFVYLPGDSEFGKIKVNGKEYPKPYGNMTYVAVKSLIIAGMKKDNPVLVAAFKWIKNNYSAKENPGGVGSQGYFYYAVAFAKAFTAAGAGELELADGKKVQWANDLAENLVSMQKEDGSFVNPDKRWMEDEPALATAYALDALNLCLKNMK